MPVRLALLLALLAPAALAQSEREFYVDAGATTGRAMDESLLIPSLSFGYHPQGGGVQVEVGAEYVRAARRRFRNSRNDFVARHGRLTAAVAYSVPVTDRVEVDLGVRARTGLDVLIRECGGTDTCADQDGYSTVGPAAGLLYTFGQLGARASGGYAWSTASGVYDGAWVRLGLRYWP